MALLGGLLRPKLRLCGRIFNRSYAPVGVRSVSDKGLPRTETLSGPDTAGDHLLYTPEHFALKESLRKVQECSKCSDFTSKIRN